MEEKLSPDSIRGTRPSPDRTEGEILEASSSPDSVGGTRTSPEIIEEEIQEERPPPVIIDNTDPCGEYYLIYNTFRENGLVNLQILSLINPKNCPKTQRKLYH